MTTSTILLALAVFAACAVESIEATTIVLAAGATHGYRSALAGAGTALVLLAALVSVVGLPLAHLVPLDVLRVVFGAGGLYVGSTWLRKAILRASGRKAIHTEDERYDEVTRKAGSAFLLSFQGVLIEGFEVFLIVVTLGLSSHHLGLAASSAGAAAVLVAALGALVAPKLRHLPENTIKFGVGILLVSFGVFWIGEGAGVAWPGADAFVLVLMTAVGIAAAGAVSWLGSPRRWFTVRPYTKEAP